MDATIAQILDTKGHEVTMVEPQVNLVECARIMAKDGIGSLLVIEDDAVLGILYERDICRRAVCQDLALLDTKAADIMEAEFPLVSSHSSVFEAMELINHYRVRHLPVIDDGALVGVVSIGDLTHWILGLQHDDINHLVRYINGGEDGEANIG